MHGRRREINLQLNQLIDSGLIAIAFFLSHKVRYSEIGYFFREVPFVPFDQFFWLMAIIVPFTPLILEFQGYYDNPLQKTVWKSLGQLARATMYLGVVIGGAVIFFKFVNESRVMLMIFPVIATALLLTKEWAIRVNLWKRVLSGELRERVVFVGIPEEVEGLYDTLPEEQRLEMNIVGKIDITAQPLDDLIHCLHENAVERVVFVSEKIAMSEIEEAIAVCEVEGVEAWLVADFIRTSIAKPTFEVIGNHPMLVFRSTPEASWALLCKTLIDRTGALIAILLTLPLWVIAAIGVRISSPGAPIIFKQERSGRHGRPFTMYKFRSMHADAEERRKELEESNEMTGPVFKIENDPRIFKFGNFIRKYSVDELPQLVNVLFGHMSLVGPRPLPVYEIENIEKSSQRRRLSVKPGLTCLWQISGRNEITDFEQWVQLDLEYIDNWTIWLDLKILVKTLPIVIFGSGAR